LKRGISLDQIGGVKRYIMCECDSVCCEHTKEVTLCETYLDVELVENRGRYLNATKTKNRNSNIHVGTHFYLVTVSSRRWCVWVCRVCVGGVGSRGVWVTKSNDKQIKVDKTFRAKHGFDSSNYCCFKFNPAGIYCW